MARPSKLATYAVAVAVFASMALGADAGSASAQPPQRYSSGLGARQKAHSVRRRHANAHRGRAGKLTRPTGAHGNGRATAASLHSAVAVNAASVAAGSSEMLFEGSRVSDFWVDHSAPGAITETGDPTGSDEDVLKMNVDNSDVYPITPTENPRAELISPDIIKPGDEFWLETKFLLPTDMPSVPGWLSLVSVYGPPFEGASPWRVGISENKLCWQRNETYDYDIPWQTSLIKGSWVTVLAHERFGSDGWVEMWINGQQIEFFAPGSYNPNRVARTQRLEMQTMDASNDAGSNSAKIMQYREAGMFEDANVYFGALKLGTTRASVGG